MSMLRERLFLSTFDACAPLLLWALHFFAAYVFAALACDTALAEQVWAGRSAVWMVLMGWSIAALLCAASLLTRAARRWREADPHARLLNGTRLGCAVLGVIGIAWTALPLLALPACAA